MRKNNIFGKSLESLSSRREGEGMPLALAQREKVALVLVLAQRVAELE